MSDAPNVGKFGEPLEEGHQGSLLFDPATLLPPDESDDEEFVEAGPWWRSPWVAAVTVLVLLGVGIAVTRSESEPEPIPETAVLPEMLPVPDPPDGLTDTILPVPSENFQGRVGTNTLVGVRALGPTGQVLRDTVVTFRVAEGNAVLSEPDVRTNGEGIAVATFALPSRPGTSTVVVSVPGSTLPESRLILRAAPGRPARIASVSGSGQAANIGELLPQRVFVSIVDAQGNPVPGASVRFRVTSGDGVVAPSQARSDSLGQASALWRLGMEHGEQDLLAFSPDVDGEVSFTAMATPRDTFEGDAAVASETAPVTVVPNRFAIGGSHVCKLESGRLACRGGDDRGQARVQSTLTFTAVSAGASHSCALNASGVAYCWGANDAGQLGDGTRSDRAAPVAVRTELRFSVLATGSAHTCGLAGSGVPLCWGQNLSGQLGDGSRNDQTLPRTVGGGLAFRHLVAGWDHTCGLTGNGNAFCWGLNSQGQLGDGNQLDRLTPTLVRGAVETLVAGRSHTCGLSEGRVLCWGSNGFGELGDGTAQDRAQPVPVQGLPGPPRVLAAGAVHTCALLTDGRAFCWGQNFQGQLGDGTTQNRNTAVAVTGGLRFSEIYTGGAQTCGITTDGTEYCWGLNQSGQLGDGTRASRSSPTRVGG